MHQPTEDQRVEERIRATLLVTGPIKRWELQSKSKREKQTAATFHRVFADLMNRGVIAFAGNKVALVDLRPPIKYPRLHRSPSPSSDGSPLSPPFAYCPYCGHRLAPLQP